MKSAKLLTAFSLILALALAGCLWDWDLGSPVESLNPFWSEETLMREPAIVGAWAEKSGGRTSSLRVEEADLGYQIHAVFTLGDRKGRPIFEIVSHADGKLLRLGGSTFLDVSLTRVSCKGDFTCEERPLEPLHTLYRVRIENNALDLYPVEYEWLERKVKEKKLAVGREKFTREFLRHASTEELQALITRLVPEMAPLDKTRFPSFVGLHGIRAVRDTTPPPCEGHC